MPKNRLSPHDRFIRNLMTNPKVIEEFFKQHLPNKISKAIDFSTIEPQKESFIDDRLRLQIADLLYAVRFYNETGYLYLLLEHASTPDRLLAFRMLKYMLAIMEHHLKKTKSQTLPLIYPLILYTGEKPYPYSMDIFDLFADRKDLAKEMLVSPYHLVDLTQVSDEALKQYMWFGTAALVAKHIKDPDILPLFKTLLEALRQLANQGEESYIYTVISYVIEAGEVSDRQDFLQTIRGLEFIDEGKLMTLAEQFRQEGYQKGIQQGMQQGMQQGFEKATHALRILKRGVSLEQVAQATGLSLQEIEELKKEIQ